MLDINAHIHSLSEAHVWTSLCARRSIVFHSEYNRLSSIIFSSKWSQRTIFRHSCSFFFWQYMWRLLSSQMPHHRHVYSRNLNNWNESYPRRNCLITNKMCLSLCMALCAGSCSCSSTARRFVLNTHINPLGTLCKHLFDFVWARRMRAQSPSSTPQPTR